MEGAHENTRARRRARISLAGLAVLAAIALILIATAIAHFVTDTGQNTPIIPTAPAVETTSPWPGAVTSEEQALAVRAMVALPAQAAQPQVLTTATAGPAIAVPAPSVSAGEWIPGGFPATPEGALGQLKVLDATALSAADPQVYADAFRQLSLAGAPDPGSTGLVRLLQTMRARADFPANGPVPDLTATYAVTHGQIKGTASGGRYVVVCVLGEFAVTVKGQTIVAGVGDCQAMRWNGVAWRIAPGPLAAAAPSAWPGTADAARAGYRELN